MDAPLPRCDEDATEISFEVGGGIALKCHRQRWLGWVESARGHWGQNVIKRAEKGGGGVKWKWVKAEALPGNIRMINL